MNKNAITNGFKNIIRTFWLSATAVSVLMVNIASVAFAFGLRTTIGFTLRQLDKQLSIVAYFNEDISSETQKQVETALENISEVEKVLFVSKDQAKEDFRKNDGYSQSFAETLDSDLFGENPFLDSLWVTPTTSEEYISIAKILESEQYQGVFNSVQKKQDVIEKLESIYRWTNITGIVLVIVFSLISIMVMINILRMSIYNYRREIEIMRLVGATNGYIQGPFIVQGILFNLFASIIVLLLFIPSMTFGVLPKLQDVLGITNSSELNALTFDMYVSLFVVIVISLGAGVAASFYATKKYLK